MFSWFLWRIWKNMNTFIYDARSFCPIDSVAKMKEDMDFWFSAQMVSEDLEREEVEEEAKREEIWKPPLPGFYKCNIGGTWDKRKSIGGCVWVLRDEHGAVLIHSRRTFANMRTKEQVTMQSLIWSIESMVSLHFSNVIFASEAATIINVVNRPIEWPAFTYQVDRLVSTLALVSGWKLVFENPASNRGAGLIAQSVMRISFSQSYIALSFSEWLRVHFENENVQSSL
ncbi:hypothetical protein V5N11_005689 [Cardamine amara subsp. amara]|uniref:RNase H type-1 domain-containing protein n=1 Tax=Cardamine amara subsp. amara TaxID=228776 RepID=A0ABD1B595_CARAN